jgi:hypothetical protein
LRVQSRDDKIPKREGSGFEIDMVSDVLISWNHHMHHSGARLCALNFTIRATKWESCGVPYTARAIFHHLLSL